MERRTRRVVTTMLGIGFAWLLLVRPASGQNLIFGSFDTPEEVAIWQNADPSFAVWSQLDFAQSPTSGSAQIANDLTSAGSTVIWAFAAAHPGEVFTFRVRAWIPPGQAGSGKAELRVVWWDASAVPGGFCPFSQVPLRHDLGASTTTIGSWERLATTLTAPPGTTCAQMRLTNHKSDAALFTVHFDEAELFVPEPMATPLGVAAIGALGLIRWRRRRVWDTVRPTNRQRFRRQQPRDSLPV